MVNLESLLTENKKVFTSGCGAEFNYSWVPSIINKLYENYVKASIKLAPKIMNSQKNAKDPDFLKALIDDPSLMKKYNSDAEKIARDAIEVNSYGMKIMIIALKKNPQPFDTMLIDEDGESVLWVDEDYENYILENMSTNDQCEFIKCVCVGTAKETEDQKKN